MTNKIKRATKKLYEFTVAIFLFALMAIAFLTVIWLLGTAIQEIFRRIFL